MKVLYSAFIPRFFISIMVTHWVTIMTYYMLSATSHRTKLVSNVSDRN